MEDSTVAAGGLQERQNRVCVDVDEGNPMVNASRGASRWLYRFHPQTPSDDLLHMARALFFPDAEERCVMNRQKVIERLRRKRLRKILERPAYFRALKLEVKTVSRSARYSSQALKEKNMPQHDKLFNALSPSDKERWDMLAADLSCEHARDIEQDVQHNVDAINLPMSRAQAERAESGLMQRVSVRFEDNDWADFGKLLRSRDRAWSL